MASGLSSRWQSVPQRFAVAWFAGLMLAFAATPAAADCNPATPGGTVTCTPAGGPQTTTVGGFMSQVIVDIQTDASIAVGPDSIGIFLQHQNSITNAGAISAGDSPGVSGFGVSGGILLFGDTNVVLNNGTITVGSATGGQVFGIQSFGLGANITNNNSIVVGDGSGAVPYVYDASGIVIFSASQVTNNGSIVTGNFSQGVFACCGNQITNSASGLIQAGNDSVTVFVAGDTNTVSNAGQIIVGNGTDTGFGIVDYSYGILLSGNDNAATNTGTIRVGDLAIGMAIDDPASGGSALTGNTLLNDTGGTIRGGNGSFGMSSGSQFIYPPDATLINKGTIIIGNAVAGVSPAIGMVAFGPAAISNSGSITVGDGDPAAPAVGIYAVEAGSTVDNAGSISAGLLGIGIRVAGDGTIVSNAGTISVGAGGVGIDVVSPLMGAFATGPAVTNSGSIVAGAGGTGVNFEFSGSLTNTGLIRASGDGFGNGGYSVFACNCTTTTITNFGTLDGRILAEGNSTVFINSGLITISDTNAVQAISQYNFNISEFGGGGSASFQQTAAGTLSLRVMPGAPAPIDSLLGDTVTLAGTLRASIQPGLYANTTITDTAVSLTGNGAATITTTFDRFVSSSPFFTVTPIYDSGNPLSYNFLTLQIDRIAISAVPGMTPNQRAVGSVLEAGYSTTLDPTSVAGQFYANLMSATSLGVLDQLSGAATAAAQDGAFTAGSQFGSTMLQQGLGWLNGTPSGNTFTFGAPLGYASASKNKLESKPGYDAFAAMPVKAQANPEIWRAWALGFGGARDTDGQFGTASQSATTFGGSFGVDRQMTSDLLFGFAAGGSTSKFSVSGLSSSGHTEAGHVGAYAVQRLGAAYIAATVNYARGDTSTERTITGVGPTETAKGRFASDQFSGRFEIGRKYGFNGYSLTPFAAIEPAALWQHAYTETSTTLGGGPGVLGLSYGSNTVTSLPLFLGAQLDARYALSSGRVLSPYARLSWVHEFKPERSITASFINIPVAGFTVDGARAAADALRVEAGGTLALNRKTTLFANVTSELSDRSRSIAALGGIKIGW